MTQQLEEHIAVMTTQATTQSLQEIEELREGSWTNLGKKRYDNAEKKNKKHSFYLFFLFKIL